MRTTKYYKVLPSVAERSGVAEMRYRTSDGMMILNEQDIRMVRLEPEEYLTGVVEAILTEEEALLLIEQGGKKMELPPVETEDNASDIGMTDKTDDEGSAATEETGGEVQTETDTDGYEVVDEPDEEPSETEGTGNEDPVESVEGTEEPVTEEVTNE